MSPTPQGSGFFLKFVGDAIAFAPFSVAWSESEKSKLFEPRRFMLGELLYVIVQLPSPQYKTLRLENTVFLGSTPRSGRRGKSQRITNK